MVRRSRFSFLRLVIALIALAAIVAGWWQLKSATMGLTIEKTMVGSIPVTVFRHAGTPSAPIIVIAHGFAGSQQLMQPFAITLARNGYLAVTFDFPGHGRNREPLRGGISDTDASGRALLDALNQVVTFARGLKGGNGKIALLGHSMASDIVVRYAESHPDTAATIAVSLFAQGVTATNPRDLLVIVGALEPAMMKDEGYRVIALAAGGAGRQRVTYGSFAHGTARRLALAGGVEHIGVLYSNESMGEALNWLNQVFAQDGSGYLDRRGPWLGLLFLGLVALARPLSSFLPTVAESPAGANLSWRQLLLVTFIPATFTPIILWKLPTDFLPLLLGDYLVVHFALFGLLSFVVLQMVRMNRHYSVANRISWLKIALGTTAVAIYSIVAIGLPIDRYVTSFFPVGIRVVLIAAMMAGTGPYFLIDEWITRGAAARRGAYILTKIGFIVSLMLAVALNPQRLFFLVIIIPVILVLFVVFGLFSRWAYRRTRHPAVGALANAVVFAWAIAVTFPVVSS